MKKIFYVFICLAISSLACLSTSSAAQISEKDIIATLTTLTEISEHVHVAEPTLTNSRQDSMTCAIVIADEALHVRELGNVDANILTWLNKNDVVEVLDQGINDWWKVRFNDVVGFARSIYLKESECVK